MQPCISPQWSALTKILLPKQKNVITKTKTARAQTLGGMFHTTSYIDGLFLWSSQRQLMENSTVVLSDSYAYIPLTLGSAKLRNTDGSSLKPFSSWSFKLPNSEDAAAITLPVMIWSRITPNWYTSSFSPSSLLVLSAPNYFFVYEIDLKLYLRRYTMN